MDFKKIFILVTVSSIVVFILLIFYFIFFSYYIVPSYDTGEDREKEYIESLE